MPENAGSQLMLKPWHVKALWFKAALQDVLLEGQKSLTVVQWQQMCSMCTTPATSPLCTLPAALCKTSCMYISRHDESIEQGDVASRVRRDEERRSLADGACNLLSPNATASRHAQVSLSRRSSWRKRTASCSSSGGGTLAV